MPSRRYTVTIQGRLGERFRATFPGVTIEPEPGHTRLITEAFDQGQLHGLLNRVRDFGFDLVAVEPIPAAPDQPGDRAADSTEAEKSKSPRVNPHRGEDNSPRPEQV